MSGLASGVSRLRSMYVTTAVVVVNTIVLAVAIDGAWALAHRWRHRVDSTLPGLAATLIRSYPDAIRAAYPDRRPDEVRALLAETWSRSFEFESFTAFREAPFRGTYVNVDAAGFRRAGRAQSQSWPPSTRAVFVFGGSTTFGYGVADEETIPAELGRQLAPRDGSAVYNFGRGSYYSSQERVLFERLLTQGYRPAVAVFIDGLNDFGLPRDEPAYAGEMRALFRAPGPSLANYLGDFAAIAGGRAIVRRFRPAPPTPPVSPLTAADIDGVIDHYLANVRAMQVIASGYGVRPVFIWQPVPGYGRPLSLHPFYRGDDDSFQAAWRGYPRARERRAQFLASGVQWCADVSGSPAGPSVTGHLRPA